jgi:putative SOS response-associated peptidase YedK
MKDRSVFGFAGLWERWKDRASGQAIQSCTIITTTPNARVTFGLSYAPEVLADVGKETLASQWRPYYVNLNAEDRAIVESIQKAAQSPLAAPGRLSPLERFTLDLGRYLVSGLRRV